MTSLKEEACSVSVFVTMASTVASSMDCEFLRTNLGQFNVSQGSGFLFFV